MEGLEFFFEHDGEGFVWKESSVFDLSECGSGILPAGGIYVEPTKVTIDDEPVNGDCKHSDDLGTSDEGGSHVIELPENAYDTCLADSDDPPIYGNAKEDGVSEEVCGSDRNSRDVDQKVADWERG